MGSSILVCTASCTLAPLCKFYDCYLFKILCQCRSSECFQTEQCEPSNKNGSTSLITYLDNYHCSAVEMITLRDENDLTFVRAH